MAASPTQPPTATAAATPAPQPPPPEVAAGDGIGLPPIALTVPDPPAVSAAGWVLYEPAEDLVLAGQEHTVGRPMASTTKVMTVLLALEALRAGQVSGEVAVSARAVEVGNSPGAATLDLEEGGTYGLTDLLAALILRSGNDGAVAVAEHVAGTEDAFTGLMNARAAELGLDATQFVNASGLTNDPEHHASPLDLALLGLVAMQDPDFAAWAGSATLDFGELGVLESRNLLLGAFPGATGVKTGFTNLAGNCLVASATRDGRTLFAVVLGSEDSFADAGALLEHGFTAWARPVPLPAGAVGGSYYWSGGEVELVAGGELGRSVPATSAVTWRRSLQPAAPRPVTAGVVLGHAELLIDGQPARRVELVAATGLAAPPAPATPREAAAAAGSALADALRTYGRLNPVEAA